MPVLAADVRKRYPEVIDYDDPEQVAFLDQSLIDAEADLSEDYWTTLYERAVSALACHYTVRKLTDGVAGEGGSTLLATGASADGLSQTLAAPADMSISQSAYASTPYGIDYIALTQRRGSGIIIAA